MYLGESTDNQTHGLSVTVRSDMTQEEMQAKRIPFWPVWEKDSGMSPVYYEFEENCYIVEGEAIITPSAYSDADAIHVKAGDFITLPQGLTVRWEIVKPLKKHFQWG
jgi:uncharacterized cupin superfamily protein